ncbi:hypothetical protein [Sphingobacterium suaedae]|uniref:Uncharacterized protein n=1 Tax=Sphingobacterium suaedae TaxID=1686402 RepID=A0ABW5KH76_9SPHI
MPNIHPTSRLLLCLREFWLINRKTIVIIPISLFLFFLIFLLWPGNFMYNALFASEFAHAPDYFLHAMNSGFRPERMMLLASAPFFIVICSNGYLKNLKYKSSYLTRPFTVNDRIFTLWISSIGIAILCFLTIWLLDFLTVQTARAVYYDKTIALLEQTGTLYPKFSYGSFFVALDSRFYFATTAFCICTMPLFHISYFVFKKNSVLLSVILFIVFYIGVFYIYLKLIVSNVVSVPFHPYLTKIIMLMLTGFVLWTFVMAVKEALREREV